MPTPTTTAHDGAPSPVLRAARVVGTTFLLIGCAGLVPGLTTHLDELHLTGPGSATALLGVLPVTVAGDVVHLALAAAAVPCARSVARARAYLVRGGALYAVLCVRSLAVGTGDSPATPHGGSALWLAVAAGLAMVVVGLVAGATAPSRAVGPLREQLP